ncbi:hypothetical protein PI124_g20705 [Phytophthora idaei]|nr:hypothetical protein PI124_g20705 [Phytophthora idaei]
MFSDPTCAAVEPEDKEEESSVPKSEGEGAEATECSGPALSSSDEDSEDEKPPPKN